MEYIIARTMILYGTGVSVRPNFALWVVEQLQKGQKIKIVNDQIGNPTLVDDLAISLYKLIEAEEYGLFHIAGNETCTRYDFAQKIANVFNLNNKPIEEITTDQLGQQAKRPMNSTFILNKLHNTIDWLPGNLDVSLQKLKVQMGL